MRTGERLNAGPFEIAARVDKLLAEQKVLDREIEKLKQRIASGGGGCDLLAEAVHDQGHQGARRCRRRRRREGAARHRRSAGDKLGFVVLAGTSGAEVKLVATVTKDLTGKVQAGKLLGDVAAQLGGRAGGKLDMAQGGGKDASAVPAALAAARKWVEEHA